MSTKAKSKGKKKQRGERTASSWLIFALMTVYLVFMWMPFPFARVIYTALTGLVAAMAAHELMNAVKSKNQLLNVLTMGVSAFMPFVFSYGLKLPLLVILPLYVLAVLFIMVSMNKKTKFVDVLTALYSSLWISFGFSCFVLIRDIYIKYDGIYLKQEGFFFVMLVFGCSWVPDGLAYLVGKRFGKHKLCPVISPKKTVEGAAGGVLLSGVALLIVYVLYSLIVEHIYDITLFAAYGWLKYVYLYIITIVLCVISIFGDLAASVIKRNFGIKDYSQLFPGHGGIMDRFDSSLFVLPCIYGLITVLNL
ncbi:MAG: phosphatidate cytidylyltransferase [Clostridia bacterium]|nr:phosphatidate cytidylyltransferase [Clostridia bacterium]